MEKMPRESWATVAANWSTPNFYRGLAAHIQAIPESLREIQQNPPIERIPVLILTAANSDPHEPEALRRISPEAREIVIEQSTHWIHLDQPHQVLKVIQTMLEELAPKPNN
jgi:pimeloyl-ACP methyl ester carboxylesterase